VALNKIIRLSVLLPLGQPQSIEFGSDCWGRRADQCRAALLENFTVHHSVRGRIEQQRVVVAAVVILAGAGEHVFRTTDIDFS